MGTFSSEINGAVKRTTPLESTAISSSELGMDGGRSGAKQERIVIVE